MKKSAVMAILATISSIAAHADAGASARPLLIEAESFADFGGWVNDTQFMDQMGSPYLLAHGLGRKVADAKTTFEAAGGEVAVFVRTKNWVRPWYGGDECPGRFKIAIDGVELPQSLGGKGDGEWIWEKAGTLALQEGGHTLALRDLDGFDGRCDAILMLPEGCEPSCDIVRALRQASCAVIGRQDYDFVVVGGGVAGICAALSASRLGLKTALVQDRPVLGGNNSSEVRVHLGGWRNIAPFPRLGDVLAEIAPRKGGNARRGDIYEDERKLAVVKAEPNLTLLLNEHVNAVSTNAAGAIVSVTAQNTRTGARTVLAAKLFADCTGDGTLGFLAGADYRMGREPKGEYGEPWAPEKEDMLTLGASVQWYADTASGDASFPLKDWMIRFDDTNGSTRLRGDWWWEAGLGRDQIAEAEHIRDYGLLVAYSNWAYAKNVASKRADLAQKELKWMAYNAGRRESRRLMGDFIITENDLYAAKPESDGTCAATWTIDLHFPKSAEKTHFDGEPFMTDSLNHKIMPYPIPYRCLYSRNVPNLFMAGRNISVSHIALGTVRLMRTGGMMGEVVGMAASLCKEHGCSPREVRTDHWSELTALMERGIGRSGGEDARLYNMQNSLDENLNRLRDKICDPISNFD